MHFGLVIDVAVRGAHDGATFSAVIFTHVVANRGVAFTSVL